MAWSFSPFSLQRVFSLWNRDVPVHNDELRLIRGFSTKSIVLLFVIFFCAFRYRVRPSFGYDRQIVVNIILILSRCLWGSKWNTNDSHRGWGSQCIVPQPETRSSTHNKVLSVTYEMLFSLSVLSSLYTNYSFTTETDSVNSSLDYLYQKYLAEPHLWGMSSGPSYFA